MTRPSSTGLPAQPRILLITTDPVMAALAVPALENSGFRVTPARSATEAVTHASTSPPDVVILNLLVDEADALSLRESIRKLPECASVPIFVVSDLFDQGLIAKVYKDAFSEFLPQPVNWMVLPHRLRKAMATGRSFAELDRYEEHLAQARDAAQSASTEALKLRNFDELTELPNRSTFAEIVALTAGQMKNRPGETAVLFIDLDRFKELNDSIGRENGDALLKAIAGRLKAKLEQRISSTEDSARQIQGSVARIHADEFAILLDQMEDRSQIERFAREVLAAVTAPYSIGGRDVFVSASLGIAIGADSTQEAFLQCAETAMRHAKRDGGRSICFYTNSMKDEVVERLELQECLRRAIDEDALNLHYQPLVEAQTGHITGVEALVRWTDPEKGAISPAVFIPIAEESDLIVSIGDWVLKEALQQLNDWMAQGLPPIRMAVNVSRSQLEEPTFVEKVVAAVKRSGVPPELLELELSERGVLRDDPLTLEKLRRLKRLGVALAIDDFGTGQTTLAYLQSFPLSVLKIDRSFVSRIDDDPATEAIIRAMIAMSHELELRVVAEGIETEYQATVLCGLQCDELQGFLFHKPMPADAVEKHLAKQASKAVSKATSVPAPRPLGKPPEVDDVPFPQAIAALEKSPPSPGPFAEVTAQEDSAHDELFRLAHVDFLTDLLNRYSFDRALETTLARAQRFGHKVALLIFDLDQFKEVNDTHGHATGDELLAGIARRMKAAVRQVDSLARLGGDEFAVIHSEFKSLEGVATLAQRLLDEIAKPVSLSVGELKVSASTGIAVFPPGDSDPKRFYRQADLALYKSKEEGGNCFHFHAQEMDRQVQMKLQLGRDLESAIENDELHLVFQPQFSVATREIVAVETLVRWNHPKRGLIPPDTFIPVAEDTGAIIRIGEWVLREACTEAHSWQTELGLDLPVSVNLSSVQFRLQGFTGAVKQILEETRLSPKLLELELTQRALLRLENSLGRLTRELDSLGVALCIDDFGTSPFSLEDLSHLPFSKLKVDGRYVHASGTSGDCGPLVGAMISLGKRLNLGIVAEAVETQAQLSALQEAGCDFAQGHYFSTPMRATELRSLLSTVGDSRRAGGSQILQFPPG